MGDTGPAGGGDPYEGIPFLGDLARMLQSSGSVSWDAARQLATSVANRGEAETNPDPIERIRFEELARVAELRVADVTGLATSTTGRAVTVLPVTRGEWARRTLDHYQPLFERLSSSLSGPGAAPAGEHPAGDQAEDPTAALLGGLFSMVGPLFLGMQAGSMVGHLAGRAFGQYDLPLPRPPSDDLLVVPDNITAFRDEWSLAEDDVRLWVCLTEITSHAVLGLPHVRERLETLVLDYASLFRPDPSALEERLGAVDLSDQASLASAFNDPEALLGVIRSPEQQALLPQLDALVAVIVGYVDHVLDVTGASLLGSHGQLSEALRRRRVEAGSADRFVERMLGLELAQAQYERGSAFI
ncbi:MAG: zinc-dependent metalloprotease, partial [Acidimicrobiia bacterium]|nr:zinc-dependent metalloprotease [Acidimicrobiia bacterium]